MASKQPLPAPVTRMRARMDRLNRRLVALLQARARLALAIGRAKERRGIAALDPGREREMLRRALVRAPDGFPRRDLERLFRTILVASRRTVVRDRRNRRG